MPEPLLKLTDVAKRFQMGDVAVDALRNVNTEIHAGEVLALLGPSGSGKSTLLNIMGGLDVASHGQVLYRGRDLTKFSAAELTRYRRDTVGFVFQFYNLVPTLTARENILVATEISRKPLDVDETLDLVGLHERTEHFPSQMSGGEQQRVSIARALAKNPDIVFCDEPTGALDFETGKKILRLLVDVRDRLGKTVVIITHNVAIAPACDRVIRLRSGEIVDDTINEHPTPPEEVVW